MASTFLEFFRMRKTKQKLLRLLKTEYPTQAEALAAAIDEAFLRVEKDVAFAKKSENPMDKNLPIAAYLLTIIMVLDQHASSLPGIRKIILELTYHYARPSNRVQQYLKSLVPALLTSTVGRYLLRRIDRQLKKAPLADGFLIDVITNKEETLGFGYGVDIRECGICKLFAKHQHQAYAPLLCEVDYITSSLAGLQLIRSGTIANGAPKCDFRYQKIK